jgi:hypothetical protein
MKRVDLANSVMVSHGQFQYRFIRGAKMIRFSRLVGLAAIAVAVSNCAGTSTLTTTSQIQPAQTRVTRADDAFWSTDPQPVRRMHQVKREIASAPLTTGSVPRDSQASVDVTGSTKPPLHPWTGPEWQAEERAETERLKRATNICHC